MIITPKLNKYISLREGLSWADTYALISEDGKLKSPICSSVVELIGEKALPSESGFLADCSGIISRAEHGSRSLQVTCTFETLCSDAAVKY
jgi:hypothetical protein